jgi:hypothetical protein
MTHPSKLLNNSSLNNSIDYIPAVLKVVILLETKIKTYIILVGKPKGKELLRRPRSRRENNIKINFRERTWEGTDCVRLAQERV